MNSIDILCCTDNGPSKSLPTSPAYRPRSQPRAGQAWESLKEKGLNVKVLNVTCLSDLDIEAILGVARTGTVITYEDHPIQTGLGSLVAGVLADHGLGVRFRRMGIARYGASGKPDDPYRMEGLDVQSLVTAVSNEVQRK